MTPNYPKKCWYVGAASEELGAQPIGRRVLDTDIVLWRSGSGAVHAFEDRCAHRGFPLSRGHVEGEQLVCGYHGCSYDASGRCTAVPTQPEVPNGMAVRPFTVVEEPPFVWVWLGPAAAAQRTHPPRLPWLTADGWSTFGRSWRVAANFMMLHEHYLDFTYAPVVHAQVVPPQLERLPAFDEIEVTETTVSYSRLLSAEPLADWEAEATGLDRSRSYRRRERGTFASPAVHVQRWEIETDDRTYAHIRTHALTPETPTSTHVFMQASRNYAADREIVTGLLREFVDELIRRESEIVEIASAHSGYDRWRSGTEFRADAAALRARRIVAVRVAQEAGRAATRPGLLSKPSHAYSGSGSESRRG